MWHWRFSEFQIRPLHNITQCLKNILYIWTHMNYIWRVLVNYEKLLSENYKMLLKSLLILTGSHELIDFRRTAFGLLHAVALLQQIVHLRQVDSWVWRHAIRRNLPKQNSKCWKIGRNKWVAYLYKQINHFSLWHITVYRVSELLTQSLWQNLISNWPHTSDLMEKVL